MILRLFVIFLITSAYSGFARANTELSDDIIYFVMTDRFADGDSTNNRGLSSSTDRLITGYDPGDKNFFHGGDLKGLKEKIPYLKQLGVTAIWMTPPFKNIPVQTSGGRSSAGYHGYWITDFTDIDPHLGTIQDLRELVETAHREGMRVYLDVVANHTADVIHYKECHDEMGSPKEPQGCLYRSSAEIGRNPYSPFVSESLKGIKRPAWLNDFAVYHNQGDTNWAGESVLNGDFSGLDDLNSENPQVLNGMIDIYQRWIHLLHVDGFRVDTVKHVPATFWRPWIAAMIKTARQEQIPNFFMFGEVYDPKAAHLAEFTQPGLFSSVLDFAFQGAIRAVVSGKGPTEDLARLFADDAHYDVFDGRYRDARSLVTFAGNHDMGRIMQFVAKDNPTASTEEKIARARLAYAMIFFARGIPTIYYGDEQAFEGSGGDAEARQDMMKPEAFDTGHRMFRSFQEFAAARKMWKALRQGYQYVRFSEHSSGLLAFSRIDHTDRVDHLVVFNTSTAPKTLDLDVDASEYKCVYGSPLQIQGVHAGRLKVTVKPLDVLILRATGPQPFAKFLPGFHFIEPKPHERVSGKVRIAIEPDAVEPRISKYLSRITFDTNLKSSPTLGQSYSEPYEVYWDTNDVPDRTPVQITARLSDGGKGKVVIKNIQVIVDSRVPETVIVDYDGHPASVFALDSSGNRRAGEFIEKNDRASSRSYWRIPWTVSDESILLVFAEGKGSFDVPILLTRRMVTQGFDDKGARPIAHISLRRGVSSRARNDALPFGSTGLFLRGSMNNWSTSDALSYDGRGCYFLERNLAAGSYEYKFASESWRDVNYGGPLTGTGLTNSGSSSNLQLKVDTEETMRFAICVVYDSGHTPYVFPWVEGKQ